MRAEQEMMNLIMEKAFHDHRIRAVTMDGSRASPNATHDQYSDYDIVYFVTDVREFTKDKSWIQYFGDILIVQYPEDWYGHPYDYESRDTFVYLIQFADGNRIDLRIVDIQNIANEAKNTEPRIILLNKDDFKELTPINHEAAFFIPKPSAMEFYNTCNEFRWVSLYVSKGLCREELCYARHTYEIYVMDMFMKMLNIKIALEHNFSVTTGSHSKYLKRYLSEEEMMRVHSIFPNGDYEDMWEKLFALYDYFAELEAYVGEQLGYEVNVYESKRVRDFMLKRRNHLT